MPVVERQQETGDDVLALLPGVLG